MSKLQIENVKNGYIVTEPDQSSYVEKCYHASVFKTLEDAMDFMENEMPKLIKRDKKK